MNFLFDCVYTIHLNLYLGMLIPYKLLSNVIKKFIINRFKNVNYQKHEVETILFRKNDKCNCKLIA